MQPKTASTIALSIAILAETSATISLKASQGFTRLWPSVIVVCGYATAFYCMSVALRTIPVGLVYAIWSGVGITLISILGWLIYKQKLDTPAIAGVVLICLGVLVIQVFSKSTAQ